MSTHISACPKISLIHPFMLSQFRTRLQLRSLSSPDVWSFCILLLLINNWWLLHDLSLQTNSFIFESPVVSLFCAQPQGAVCLSNMCTSDGDKRVLKWPQQPETTEPRLHCCMWSVCVFTLGLPKRWFYYPWHRDMKRYQSEQAAK